MDRRGGRRGAASDYEEGRSRRRSPYYYTGGGDEAETRRRRSRRSYSAEEQDYNSRGRRQARDRRYADYFDDRRSFSREEPQKKQRPLSFDEQWER